MTVQVVIVVAKPKAFDESKCTCRPPGYMGYDYCRQGCDPECPECSYPEDHHAAVEANP